MRNKEIFIGLLALVLAIPLGFLLAFAYLGRIAVQVLEIIIGER